VLEEAFAVLEEVRSRPELERTRALRERLG
jgi:hypothetical protein